MSGGSQQAGGGGGPRRRAQDVVVGRAGGRRHPKWLDDVKAKFEQQNGVKIKSTLMDTDNVIPQFTNAAAAGHPPDLQFFFNGIYHMENVWLGYIKPLNGLVADDVLASSGATKLSTFEGKQYRVGFYAIGFGLSYNKKHFENAKLDPDNPPKTWDEFMEACAKLKERGTSRSAAGSRTASSASGTS